MRDPEMMVTPQEARKLFEESTLFDKPICCMRHTGDSIPMNPVIRNGNTPGCLPSCTT